MLRFTVALITAVAALAGWGALAASAGDSPAEVSLTIENNRFWPDELRVKAGVGFVLIITNKDGTVEEFESRGLRIEKVVPAAKSVRLRMPALKPGTYPFVGEYHEQSAQGRIVAE
jgi:plastocyanin